MNIAPAASAPGASRNARDMTLLRWVWRTYVRNALIPLLVVELLLVAVYVTSHAWSLRKNVEAMRAVARQEISRIAAGESAVIDKQLSQVAAMTEVLRRQTALALDTPAASAPNWSRLKLQESGALTTASNDGGAAVFYSARTPKGPAQYEKMARLGVLDPLLRHITESNPLIVQTYVNTDDSLNRIWPWIDAARQLDPDIDLRAFNFYYEADVRHNPQRAVVWTDAYVDPAGQGWMVSAIAPVYRGDFLEAVVGADVTIDRMIARMLNAQIPWQGFLLLIGKDGTLLALTHQGEQLFALKELTAHRYVDYIRADTFKPEEFNVYRRKDFAAIGDLLARKLAGFGRLEGPRPHLVAWQTIPAAGWKLMALVPEENVLGASRALSKDLAYIGWIMVVGLVGFYAIFLTYLYRRARYVSASISQPLRQIERMAHQITVGEYEQVTPEFGVSEFAHTVGELQHMGRLLGDSDRARQSAEARLTERNAELTTILSLSPDGLVSFDIDGCVTETNPAFLALTGWSRSDLIGKARADFWAKLGQLGPVTEPQPGAASVLRLLRPHPRVVECRVVGAGSPQVAYFRDITSADELDRMKSQFLATAAHELRTPIAVITGYTEFLQASDPPAVQRSEILSTMRRHGDHITGIVTELLDLARIEARAGRDFTMIRQPLAPAVRRFVETFRFGEDARVPILSGDIGDADAYVDADKYCQALGNVLSNACKYSPAGAPVAVRLAATETEVGVEVRDEGAGMEEKVVGRIFDRFYRGEESSAVPGTGLGMTIVKEILDIHGGRVEISSRPQHGTTVILWLPRAMARG